MTIQFCLLLIASALFSIATNIGILTRDHHEVKPIVTAIHTFSSLVMLWLAIIEFVVSEVIVK